MKKRKRIIIVVVVIIMFVLIGLYVTNKMSRDNSKTVDLKQVSKNHQIDDEMITFLYDRYHPEDQLKFQIVGSDIGKYYGFYYQKKKVMFQEIPSIYKNYILLDLINYDDRGYDENRNCYLYPLDEYKDIYQKYYGSLDDFDIDTSEEYSPRFYLNKDTICISKEENLEGDYKKTIDTYFVNGIYQDDEIIIYEKVAFVKINDKNIEFYKDYSMKNKVYTLKGDQVDRGFIHNSKIVSNVLIEYQDQFPLYEYRYIKGDNTYYLESISR